MPTPPKPTAATQRLTAWSFSRWNDYRKCAKYAFFKHVLRMKEPGNDAMERGGKIGDMAEAFAVANSRKKCPTELQTFEMEFRTLQKIKGLRSEEEWAFTQFWAPTGWFDKDAWCRVKVDCFYAVGGVGKVIDYKTGKVNEAHLEQLSLYALAAMLQEDDLEEVTVELWYLDHGVLKPDEPKKYTRADIPALKKEWAANTKPMLSDGKFAEKPSKACGWCHFSKGKGGPCKY